MLPQSLISGVNKRILTIRGNRQKLLIRSEIFVAASKTILHYFIQ